MHVIRMDANMISSPWIFICIYVYMGVSTISRQVHPAILPDFYETFSICRPLSHGDFEDKNCAGKEDRNN